MTNTPMDTITYDVDWDELPCLLEQIEFDRRGLGINVIDKP